MLDSPYHPGEREMQRNTGEERPASSNGRLIVPNLVAGAGIFIEQQPFVIVSSQDAQGRIWTSILSGEEGYVKVIDEKTLLLDGNLIQSNRQDSFWENIQKHPFIGMLFIDLDSRQQYRINGQIRMEQDQVLIRVMQAYVNCPKYIQHRLVTFGKKPAYQSGITRGTVLTNELISWISEADTFFVGSSNGQEEMDASHRGGNPGFVEVVKPSFLRIPDYKGNSMYNTLGNFLVYPQAGLLFLYFHTPRTLQLTGTVKGIPSEKNLAVPNENTGRYWTFSTGEWVLLENLYHVEWSFPDYYPYNPD